MLGRDQHALDLDRALNPALVDLVPHRHLRLPVGTEVRKHVRLAHLGETLREPVRDQDRKRHELVRLAGRVAEHHPLVAGAEEVDRVDVSVLRLVRLVHPLRDIRRLLVDRDDDTARLEVESVLRPRVANLGDPFANHRADVDVGVRRDLARDDHETGRDERLAGDPSVRVVCENRVENGVRDLIRDLVRMTLGDRLRRERERTHRHGREGYLVAIGRFRLLGGRARGA